MGDNHDNSKSVEDGGDDHAKDNGNASGGVEGVPGVRVAWVKLGKIWWPGKVLNEDEMTEEMKKELESRKSKKTKGAQKDVHVVKYFNEDDFTLVKDNPQDIIWCPDEEKKLDLVKRAILQMKSSPSLADNLPKFKADVIQSEQLLNPSADLTTLTKILDGETLEPKKPAGVSKYADIFPSPKPEKPPVNSPLLGVTNARGKGSVKFNFPSSRIISTASSKPLSKLSPLPSDPSKKFRCHFCGFSVDRVNVLTNHMKYCSAKSSPLVAARSTATASTTPSPTTAPQKVVTTAVSAPPVLKKDISTDNATPKRAPGRPPRGSKAVLIPTTTAPSPLIKSSPVKVVTTSPVKTPNVAGVQKKRGRRSTKRDKMLSDKQKAEILQDWNDSSSEGDDDTDDELDMPPSKPPELFLFGSEKNKKRKADSSPISSTLLTEEGAKKVEEDGKDAATPGTSGVDGCSKAVDEDQPPVLKKPRTDKELSDAFEALLKNTKPEYEQLLDKDLHGKDGEEKMDVDQEEEDVRLSDIEEDALIVMKKVDVDEKESKSSAAKEEKMEVAEEKVSEPVEEKPDELVAYPASLVEEKKKEEPPRRESRRTRQSGRLAPMAGEKEVAPTPTETPAMKKKNEAPVEPEPVEKSTEDGDKKEEKAEFDENETKVEKPEMPAVTKARSGRRRRRSSKIEESNDKSAEEEVKTPAPVLPITSPAVVSTAPSTRGRRGRAKAQHEAELQKQTEESAVAESENSKLEDTPSVVEPVKVNVPSTPTPVTPTLASTRSRRGAAKASATIEDDAPKETPKKLEPKDTSKKQESKETPKKPEPKDTPKKPESKETPKKPESKETTKKPESKEIPKKPESKETPKKAESKETSKKTEPKETHKKPEPKETPKKPEPKETPKKPEPKETPKKPEPKETPKKPEPKETPKKPEPKETPKKPEPKETPKKPETKDTPEKTEVKETLKQAETTEVSKKPEQKDVKKPEAKETPKKPEDADTPKNAEPKETSKVLEPKESPTESKVKELSKKSEAKESPTKADTKTLHLKKVERSSKEVLVKVNETVKPTPVEDNSKVDVQPPAPVKTVATKPAEPFRKADQITISEVPPVVLEKDTPAPIVAEPVVVKKMEQVSTVVPSPAASPTKKVEASAMPPPISSSPAVKSKPVQLSPTKKQSCAPPPSTTNTSIPAPSLPETAVVAPHPPAKVTSEATTPVTLTPLTTTSVQPAAKATSPVKPALVEKPVQQQPPPSVVVPKSPPKPVQPPQKRKAAGSSAKTTLEKVPPPPPVLSSQQKNELVVAPQVATLPPPPPVVTTPAVPPPPPVVKTPVQPQKKPTAAVRPLVDTKEPPKEIPAPAKEGKGTATTARGSVPPPPTTKSSTNSAPAQMKDPSVQNQQPASVVQSQPSPQSQQQQQSIPADGGDGSADGKKSPALVAQRVVHLVPVENADGSITYMLLSLENGADNPAVLLEQGADAGSVLRLDKVEPMDASAGGTPGQPNLPMNPNEVEGIFLDKNVDNANQIVSALAAAAASTTGTVTASSSLMDATTTAYVTLAMDATSAMGGLTASAAGLTDASTVTAATIAHQQAQSTIITIPGDASSVTSQEASQEQQQEVDTQQVFYMTEDGALLDPASLGLTLEQLQQLLSQQ